MPVNVDLKNEKCWACEHFCGKRKYNSGIVGDSVNTDSEGTCGNKRSHKYGQKIASNNWCTKFSRWSRLDLELAKEDKRKELFDEINQKTFKFTDTKFGRFLISPIGIASIIYCALFLFTFIFIISFATTNISKYDKLINEYVNNGGSYFDQYVQELSDARAPYVILEYLMPLILVLLIIAFIITIIIIKKKKNK